MATRRDFLRSAAVAAAAPTIVGVHGCAAESGPRDTRSSDIQARLEEALERHRVVGASAAVFDNGTVTTAAAGLVNLTTGVDMTPGTVMHIGSITKIFNTTILMQLVDDGLVDLSAPVSTYLPELRLRDPDHLRRITVGMLVNHTSGIDGELVPDQGHDRETIRQAIPRFADMGKIHEPGADCSYCNTAHVIAGHLAQTLRGESWYDLVKSRIFEPLEMEHAAALPEDALLHRASVGHHTDPESGQPYRTSIAFLPLSFAPAGATLMMSARALVTFAAAHIDNGMAPNGARVLSAESARAMQTPTARYRGKDAEVDFGLGWRLEADGLIGHSGGGPGILSVLYAHPESKVAAAVLTNSDHGGAMAIELIREWMSERSGVAPTAPAVRPLLDTHVDANMYTGTYETVASWSQVVEWEGGIGIRSRAKARFYDSTSLEVGPTRPLGPVGDHLFAYLDDNGDPTGAVLTFLDPGPDGRMAYYAQSARLMPRSA